MEINIPKVAWLSINSKCNLRCKWCYNQGNKYQSDDMSLDTARNLIVFLDKLGVKKVTLLGGEPTLHPNLIEIVVLLLEHNIKASIVTNGIMLADKAFAKSLVGAGIDSIAVSIKGVDDNHYKKLTGSKGYSKAMVGYQNLKDLDFDSSLSITWTKNTAHCFSEMLGSLIKQGVTHLGMDFGTPFLVENKVSAEGILNPKESAELLSKILFYLSDKKEVTFSFYVTFPLCLIEKESRDKIIDQNLVSTTCHVPSGSAIIFDQKGRVLPCSHMTNMIIGQFGVDFNDLQSFKSFWGSNEVGDFRKQCRFYPHDRCSGCGLWTVCGGGCILNWTNWSPNNFILDERR